MRWQQDWGGRAPEGDILVLTHRKLGHNHQALAVAEALAKASARNLRHQALSISEVGWIIRRLLGRGPGSGMPATTAVIVASGWLPTRVARWLAASGERDLRLVLMGRKAGSVPDHGAVVVRCGHYNLPWHPAQLETLLPLNAGYSRAAGDNVAWQTWLAASPRVALLVGGDSRSHVLTRSEAERMARAVSNWVKAAGARLLLVSGRRTSGGALAGLREGMGAGDLLYAWYPGNGADNPYSLALQRADTLIVTGESESMLADAVASGRQLLIWPLPERSPGPWRRFCAWVDKCARQTVYNRRGTVRPQRGLTYLCARSLERNWVLPSRKLENCTALW